MEEHDPSLENELVEVAFGEPTAASRAIMEKLGRELTDGEVLFREGDAGSDLFIVVGGHVAVSRAGHDGSPVELAVLGPGEILGEMSHFDDEPRSATAAARGATRVMVFSRNNFSLIFQLHPKWTTQLVAGLAGRIRRTLEGLTPRRD